MRALWDLPVHFVRLDISQLPGDDLRPAMLAATIGMAEAAGIAVIASGAERPECARELFGLGIGGVQGVEPSLLQPVPLS